MQDVMKTVIRQRNSSIIQT